MPGRKNREINTEFKFEEAVKKLEGIVKKFETEEVDLDDSVKLFEEGMRLSAECSRKLDEVEKKIELIIKNKNGGQDAGPFNPDVNDENEKE